MPLSQSQIDAISKLPEGAAIISQIETDIEAAITPLQTRVNIVSRDNVEKKAAVKNYIEQIQLIGLDPTKPLKDQFDELQEKAKGELSKTMKPSTELEAVLKKMEKQDRTITDLLAREEQLKTQNRREKASSTFAPLLPDHFGKAASLILKNAIADGVITVDENGTPGVKSADGEFLIGEAAINELKKIHADLVITKQKLGSGNTPAKGGTSSGGAAKTMTRAEFDALPMDQQMTFCTKDGGKIEG